MAERLTLPVLPLRETVVFPGVAVPITAGRAGTIEAIQAALKEDRQVFAVAQIENVDDVTPEVLHRVGVIARVVQTQRTRGGMQLLLQAEGRATAVAYHTAGEGMLVASVMPVLEQDTLDPKNAAFVALDRELRERSAALGKRRGIPAEALTQLIEGIPSPGAFTDMVSFYLEVPAAEKQSLLEEYVVENRMRRVLVAVERDLLRLEAQEEIQQKVQEELGDKQREMLLREQMRAIQKELGDEDEAAETDELKERLTALELPEEVRAEVNRELKRLERTNAQSAEYQVIRTYLEWVTELPWSTRTDDKIDLGEAERILDEDHYGLPSVKDRVLEFLAVRKLQMERSLLAAQKTEADELAEVAAGDDVVHADVAIADPSATKARAVGHGPILLFVGPPGVGKTSIAKSIARALGRKYVRIALGGARDEADIRGHRRTYVGAMPGRIIHGLRQAGTKNPVVLLDEVDKLGVSYQGNPAAALLEVLDPAQNSTFTDNYMGVPFDLSEVLFVATANFLDSIPAPLLDRMERVDFAGYTELEKLQIAKRFLMPRQLEESGLDTEELQVEDAALKRVISGYTRESGVRQLERELGKLARKAARRIAGAEAHQVVIGERDVDALLGRPRVHPETAAAEDAIGVATGMYYTPMGGDIMFVEASVSKNKDNLILTGQLGDVMKESARAALTYAKTHHDRFGIPVENLNDLEIHIHVPAGAIPKDGPSAGVTMGTALVSALSGRPARFDVAMTGEITLTGRVLPIGGLKEKVLGAYRSGIREIILPRDNEADLDDLPEEVRQHLTFHAVSSLGEVLAIALRGANFSNGTLTFPETGAAVAAERFGSSSAA
jgi:ATP-dependent Lon protease